MAASAQVTDHDFGDDQDPLLVRPFVLQETESPSAEPSTQTWPAAITRDNGPAQATADDDPTSVILLPDPPRRRFRRRLVVIGGVGAVVLLAAAAAGFAALRPGMSASISAGPAGSPLPVVTGPAPSGVASASAPLAPAPGVTHQTRRSGAASASASATSAATPGAPADPGASATTATTASPSEQPHLVAPATASTGTIRGQNGLCLDLNGGVAVADNHVQVFTCNGTAAQTWTLATDGTLRVQGMCALIDGDSTVHIITCDGRTTARWRVSNSTLINAADDECLTDPSGGSQSGAGAVVSACGGSASQRWSLP
jgi:hypothetical protein